MDAPISLINKLDERKALNAYRQLRLPKPGMVDFCSNDYLGIAKNNLLPIVNCESSIVNSESLQSASALSSANPQDPVDCQLSSLSSGSTGSRLLAGNYELIEDTEKIIAAFHETESALIFNSGYDANVGLLSSVPQKGDTIIYDSLSHASIRDGIRLSFAQAYSFLHNDINDLEKKLQHAIGNIYVVTESVFSMDGDLCPLNEIVALCEKYGAWLIIDEAHATGVIGERGEGLVQQSGLHNHVFARVHTFGKACGCHGAAVVGSLDLKNYLINFARSFIYSTALPAHAVHFIKTSYEVFPSMTAERKQLQLMKEQFQKASISNEKLTSNTPIQVVVVPGNEAIKKLAGKLQQSGLDVRPILYPTVPKGKERLRIVLHSFNSTDELQMLINALQ
jgi:8-amino-7-oxononanoate synthase